LESINDAPGNYTYTLSKGENLDYIMLVMKQLTARLKIRM